MKEELIEIVNEWDKEGYLVKKTANNVPIFIPKHLAPQVQIIDLDTEWVTQKIYMTKKQFSKEYGSMLAHLHEEGLLTKE